MDNVERQLLNCLSSYRTGRKQAAFAGLKQEEWPQLYQAAKVHKLGAVVHETLRSLPEFCDGNASLAASWQMETIVAAAGQTRRTSGLLRITKALERGSIPYAVVKGAVCRELYAQPDLRTSGDEDILIAAEQQEACAELFRAEGLELLEAKEGDPVTHWIDRQTGLHIELHTALMPGKRTAEKRLNQYFSDQLDCTVAVPVQGGTVQTLCPTAHLLFLVCHALKHFIAGGFGIRTVSDILTFAERYGAQIDKASVYSGLETARGRIFFDQLLSIGQQYLEFDLPGSGWALSAPPDPAQMLEDILDAGIYGQSSMSRRHSGALVQRAAEEGETRPSVIRAAFPPKERLVGRYPILQQHPALLPVIWLRRIGSYGLELLKSPGKDNSLRDNLALGKRRTEMMIRYGIISRNKRED